MITETENAYHFYIGDNEYLGMLTYGGQLSDFRAHVIRNKISFSGKSREKTLEKIKAYLYTLLNAYMTEQAVHTISDPQKFQEGHVREFKKDFKELRNLHRFLSRERIKREQYNGS